MTYTRDRARWIAFIMAVGVMLHTGSVAWAHGRTTVGDYELVIGFHNEPAYQSEPNGLDLFVTNTRTGEKVMGLEDTLQAELIYGSAKKELPIEAQFGEEGAYTAHVQPTQVGDYTWHIFGTIGDTPVDVSMTSGPDTFGTVESKATVAFPAAEPTPSEVARTSRTALLLGGAGTLLGLVGMGTALLALRRRAQPAARPRGEHGAAHG